MTPKIVSTGKWLFKIKSVFFDSCFSHRWTRTSEGEWSQNCRICRWNFWWGLGKCLMNNHFVSRVFKYEKLAKLQNTRPLWSASLTCVGRLWRPRLNTIYAILIQWHVNEWPGILQLLREIFHWVSKVYQDCVSFTLLCSVIGPENLRHS